MFCERHDGRGWGDVAHGLSRTALDALLRCDIPAIRVADFATATECVRFVEGLEHACGSEAATSPMRLIGSNFSNHHGAAKAAYFDSVPSSLQSLGSLTAVGFDPVQRVLDVLGESWTGDVQIADEGAPYGRYFAGCVKTRVAGSALHYDYVPDMVCGYAISAIRAQLSWNLYLEVPANTGETTLYQKLVDPRQDLVAREPGAVARWDNLVSPQAVAGSPSYTFKAAPGELVMFNTRCPHSIAMKQVAPHERRIQIGGFAGLTADNNFILWS